MWTNHLSSVCNCNSLRVLTDRASCSVSFYENDEFGRNGTKGCTGNLKTKTDLPSSFCCAKLLYSNLRDLPVPRRVRYLGWLSPFSKPSKYRLLHT
jgi:hypothetical protein